jgi:hypothetical protein
VPGPNGGLYVIASAPRQGDSGPAGRTVIALLDPAGLPQPGWPIELVGWTCLRPGDDEAPWTPSTDAEGSFQVVCFSDEADDGTWHTTAFAFDLGASLIDSWPLAEGVFDPQPRIIDRRLHAISRDENAPDTIWMTTVEAAGTIQRGQPITIPGLGQIQLGPDGTGYGISYSGDDGTGPVQSEVQAFDMAGLDGLVADRWLRALYRLWLRWTHLRDERAGCTHQPDVRLRSGRSQPRVQVARAPDHRSRRMEWSWTRANGDDACARWDRLRPRREQRPDVRLRAGSIRNHLGRLAVRLDCRTAVEGCLLGAGHGLRRLAGDERSRTGRDALSHPSSAT